MPPPRDSPYQTLRRRLEALDVPRDVLYWFDLLMERAQKTAFDDLLEDLLMDAARRANWTKPWEGPEDVLTFRACTLPQDHPEYCPDLNCEGYQTPAVEQAYRRGYCQGMARARQILELEYGADHPVAIEEKRIDRWRTAPLHLREGSVPGHDDGRAYPLRMSASFRRSGLPSKKRWAALRRDGFRCTACGARAEDGARLEVDHKIPYREGGDDEVENLQTLCLDCNRGKAGG